MEHPTGKLVFFFTFKHMFLAEKRLALDFITVQTAGNL